MISEELEAVRRPIETASGLPNVCYTSAAYARMERETVLSSGWTCIGSVHEFTAGSARPIELLGLPLMLVCDKLGVVRVFHNVCRHRGHRLLMECTILKDAVRCPYHHWTYNFDGTLRETPHIGGYKVHQTDAFEREAHGLWQIRSATWLGLLFINLSGDAPCFENHISAAQDRWEELIGPSGFSSLYPVSDGGQIELELNANWKLAVENYCESYHLPWVHPKLSQFSSMQHHYSIVCDGWGAGQGTNGFALEGASGLKLPEFTHWPKNKRSVAEYIALFPNVLMGLHSNHFFAMMVVPLSYNRTIEICQIYGVGSDSLSEQTSASYHFITEFWTKVFKEDISPIEGMQLGRESSIFDGGLFSPELDVANHHFHKWIAARYPVSL